MFSLDSIFSSNSDILCVLLSFLLFMVYSYISAFTAHLRFAYIRYRISIKTYIRFARFVVQPFGFRLLWLLLTSHSSLLLRLMEPPVRPHGISRQSFLVYLPDLRIWVTIAFWTSLPIASLSAIYALLSGFCSAGYDFAIPSSRLYLTIQTLGVALGFVGNYAPCGLSPQIDGMPVIQLSRGDFLSPLTPPYVPFGIRRFNITSKHDVRCSNPSNLQVPLLSIFLLKLP